jgi:hypothetical protein
MSKWLRAFTLVSLIGFGSAGFGSNVEYFDSLVHERVLVGENWTGNYIQSLYSIPLNIIRIDLYEQGKGWVHVGQIPADQAGSIQTQLISRLHHLELSLNASPADQKEFERVIRELTQEGLSGWVKEGRRAVRLTPEFSSARVIKSIAAVFAEVMVETPKRPQPNPPPPPPQSVSLVTIKKPPVQGAASSKTRAYTL